MISEIRKWDLRVSTGATKYATVTNVRSAVEEQDREIYAYKFTPLADAWRTAFAIFISLENRIAPRMRDENAKTPRAIVLGSFAFFFASSLVLSPPLLLSACLLFSVSFHSEDGRDVFVGGDSGSSIVLSLSLSAYPFSPRNAQLSCRK